MAGRKRKRKSAWWTLLGAVLAGVVIGGIVFNPPDEAPPPPPDISYDGPYDDEWGKLETPVPEVEVTHILISWADAGLDTIKDKERTKDEAQELTEQIWHKYRNEPTESNWKRLQEEYNEDSAPADHVYKLPVPRGQNDLVPPFKKVAKSTQKNFARIAETQYGYHLIRREN